MKSTFLFILLSFSIGSFGQKSDFAELENMMVENLKTIRNSTNDEERNEASSKLRSTIIDALNTEGSFDYPFIRLSESMSNIISPDNKMRIYNWNVSHEDYTNSYFAFVQFKNKKENSSTWHELTEYNKRIDKIESKYLKPEKWYGALYYKIIPTTKGKKTSYTVLGWNGIDKSTQQKVIDVISVNSNKLRLGAPIFKAEKGTKKRVMITYSKDVMVSLKWREKEGRIVFDHVVPKDPSMKGAYAFYTPDLSFDAYNMDKKGKWIFEGNVDVRMGKSEKPYHNPSLRKRRRGK